MSIMKFALAAATVIAIGVLSAQPADARLAWYGPGSGPVSPYKNYKGFAQVPRQFGANRYTGARTNYVAPSNGNYHCVPNVGLVGPNGVCP
jgi:hypothetical protein